MSEIFDNYDDMYSFSEQLMLNVMNEHAPIKQRTIKHNNLPYMNSELRKCINVKNMLRRKYTRDNSKENWDSYRKQRNRVVKLRKISMSKYVHKCTEATGSVDFWKTVKPLISDRCTGNDRITLV